MFMGRDGSLNFVAALVPAGQILTVKIAMGFHAGWLISRAFQHKVKCSQADQDQFFMFKPQSFFEFCFEV